jgi:hypothetical protein
VLMFFATCSVAGCIKHLSAYNGTYVLYHRGYVR